MIQEGPDPATGMPRYHLRRSEIAGLLWHNVDLEAARLTINQQIVSVQYQFIESDLSTPTSRRSINLDPEHPP